MLAVACCVMHTTHDTLRVKNVMKYSYIRLVSKCGARRRCLWLGYTSRGGRVSAGRYRKRSLECYVQATHARQCCPLYLRWLYLYLCSSDLTVHEPRGAWVLPRSSPAKKRVLDINGYLVSKAPCTCARSK